MGRKKKETESPKTEKPSKKEKPLTTEVTPTEKKTRLTKKKLAKMSPEQAAEVTAATVEARRQARQEKRIKREAEEEDLRQSLAPRRPISKEEEWNEDETVFEAKQGWVVVLTPGGHIYQEPVPRYCSLQVFLAILCSYPEISESSRIRMEANISKTVFPHGEISSASFGNVTVRNNYASQFDLQNETAVVGGNLVFSGKDDTAFTKKQASAAVNWIIKQLSKEEDIIID